MAEILGINSKYTGHMYLGSLWYLWGYHATLNVHKLPHNGGRRNVYLGEVVHCFREELPGMLKQCTKALKSIVWIA